MKYCLLYMMVIGMLVACKTVKQEADYCTVPITRGPVFINRWR